MTHLHPSVSLSQPFALARFTRHRSLKALQEKLFALHLPGLHPPDTTHQAVRSSWTSPGRIHWCFAKHNIFFVIWKTIFLKNRPGLPSRRSVPHHRVNTGTPEAGTATHVSRCSHPSRIAPHPRWSESELLKPEIAVLHEQIVQLSSLRISEFFPS